MLDNQHYRDSGKYHDINFIQAPHILASPLGVSITEQKQLDSLQCRLLNLIKAGAYQEL